MFDVWISERGTGAVSCAGEAVRALRARLHGDTNHVHLLVKDTAGEAIAQSMQLIAGRTRGSWFKVQGSTVQG
jgi:hypothetical protein